ncbi:hypothetical protein JOD57_000660 [Geodermatophilus bullaregiensis]|uniref:hypothetical protein n=1 Tax=Geodermatophilus bullaregiensis TaxID=1564160 RepID=UPI001957DC58|nr:hypothetical protein [Geodermatophilus bullaregiensis]MBM7804823.1 hypothetical protein [Geodermatophilus bullaregiensis]
MGVEGLIDTVIDTVIGAMTLVAVADGEEPGPDWVAIGVGALGALATLASAYITARYQGRKRDDRRRSKIKGNDLDVRGITEKDSFSALDVIKVLDLRSSPDLGGRAGGGHAVLTDSHLIVRERSSGNGVVFCYATSGDFDGVTSKDHIWKWDELQPHSPLKKGLVAKCYGLGVDLDTLSVDHVSRVTNQIVYRGAFDQADHESFETHIDRSTVSLTFVILFSPSYPCVSAVGEENTVRDHWARVEDNRPVVLDGGQCLYWRVFRDDAGSLPHRAKYRLQWDWQPAAGATAPGDAARTRAGTS